jgi:hypothetical protein
MATRTDRDQQWRDDQLMGITGGSYQQSIPGLRFVVPAACAPKGDNRNRGDDTKTPGIYLVGIMPSSGPVLPPKHVERLLTREEALEYARNYDRFARPGPYERPGEMFARGKPEDYYPPTWEAFIEAWYECLARRLDAAITQHESRRSELREVRAALTGRIGEESQ